MDDLQRELGRLETQLGEATPGSRIIDELAAMRGELARPAGGDAPFKLANLRIATPCKERWADMTGDERVRACNGCDRPVFNLSELTRDQAEAVLATRGIKPCVRFYQRVDGTVMTADCPTVPRRSRRLTVIAAGALLGSSPAMADDTPTDETPTEAESTESEPTESEPTTDPATDPTKPHDSNWMMGKLEDGEWTMGEPDDEPDDGQWTMGVMVEPEAPKRSMVEWSTWARLGYGIASQPSTVAARSTTPLMPRSSQIGEGALGVDVSVGVARRDTVRIGAWAEWRTVSEPVVGGELIVGLPSRHGIGIVLRAGGNAQVGTGALGVGTSKVRIVTSMTRSDDPREWSVTTGLEFDPIGVLRWILSD